MGMYIVIMHHEAVNLGLTLNEAYVLAFFQNFRNAHMRAEVHQSLPLLTARELDECFDSLVKKKLIAMRVIDNRAFYTI